MADRAAVITGASKGLGRALLRKLAREGWSVLGTYASDPVAAESALDEIGAVRYPPRLLRMDSAEIDARPIDRWLSEQAAEDLLLINNATAAFTPAPFHLIPSSDLRKQLITACLGAFDFSQLMVRYAVRAQSGTIVNVATSALYDPVPKGFSAYLTAKAGLIGLTRALAPELSSYNIRLFSVSPDFMATPLTDAWPERLRPTLEATRLTPDMAADMILALVADRSVEGCGEDYRLTAAGCIPNGESFKRPTP